MQSNEISTRLSNANLRPTLKRVQVMQLFMDSPGWEGSIDQIFRALFDKGVSVSITDIYRIIRSFEDHGLVSKSYTAGRLVPLSVYSLNGEASAPRAHQHRFACRLCRNSIEFNDESLSRELERASLQHGFTLEDSTRTSFSGMCKKCRDLTDDISHRGTNSRDANMARSNSRKRLPLGSSRAASSGSKALANGN